MKRPRLVMLAGGACAIVAASGAVGVVAGGGLGPGDSARAELPGQVAATLTRTGQHLVFHEPTADNGPSALLTAAEVEVLDPLGAPVRLRAADKDQTYERNGRVGTAIALFDAERTGTYLAAVTATDPVEGALAIGDVSAPRLPRLLLWAALMASGALLVAVAVHLRPGRAATVRARPRTTTHHEGEDVP